MNFQEQLKRKREASEASIPHEILVVMHRATKELQESGIQDKVIKVGEEMPAFVLYDQDNNPVNSTDILSQGPLVITFYRGYW